MLNLGHGWTHGGVCGGGVFAICWSEVGIGFKRLQNPAAGLAVSGCFEHPEGRGEQCPFL